MKTTKKFSKAKYLLEFKDFVAEISSAEVSKLWDILKVCRISVDPKQKIKWRIVLIKKVSIGTLKHLLVFKRQGRLFAIKYSILVLRMKFAEGSIPEVFQK